MILTDERIELEASKQPRFRFGTKEFARDIERAVIEAFKDKLISMGDHGWWDLTEGMGVEEIAQVLCEE